MISSGMNTRHGWRRVLGAAVLATLIVGFGAASASARDNDAHRGWTQGHAWRGDYGRDWRGYGWRDYRWLPYGYYTPPPVVYPPGYYAPPPAYYPGFNFGLRIR